MAETTNQTQVCHIEYAAMFPLWNQMSDTYAGQHAVKNAGEKYLPMTEGQRIDNDNGKKRYDAYKLRANYFNYVADTITAMLGVMYYKDPKVELPARIETMIENSNPDDESLEALMRRVNENQLVYGRYGLLLDIPDGEGAGITPLIVEYPAVKILNWYVEQSAASKQLKFVVLDESGAEYDLKTKRWTTKEKYRICGLDDTGFYYSVSLSREDFEKFDFVKPILTENDYPTLAGKNLEFIPFTFVNVTSITPGIEEPPLLPLSNICLAIYRGEADYRQTLFMQGQDTLFAKGIDKDSKLLVGAGRAIVAENVLADAKFIGVSGQGLPEQRQSQETLHDQARSRGVALIESSQAESGEALKTKLAVKTASMKTIAQTGAQAVAEQLKFAAIWANENETDVKLSPNLDFNQSSVAAADALQLWSVKIQGAPLSDRSYHAWLKKNEFTTKEYEEERAEIQTEEALNYGTKENQDTTANQGQ